MKYVPAEDCEVAHDYLNSLLDDPMSALCGCMDEIVEGYMRRHVQKCKRCMDVSVEASTP